MTFDLRVRKHNCMCGAPCGRGLQEEAEALAEKHQVESDAATRIIDLQALQLKRHRGALETIVGLLASGPRLSGGREALVEAKAALGRT